jgi:hypothetical protein
VKEFRKKACKMPHSSAVRLALYGMGMLYLTDKNLAYAR